MDKQSAKRGKSLTQTKKAEHTATPWKVEKARSLYASTPSWIIETEDGRNTPVSAILKEADAAHIVTCVNTHNDLLAVVDYLLENMQGLIPSKKLDWIGDVLNRATEDK